MDSHSIPNKLVIISDLHIGGDQDLEDFECQEELISFLDHLEKEKDSLELIILGDFFDLWKFEKADKDLINLIIKNNKSLFEKIKTVGKIHKITLIPGNHDHAIIYVDQYREDLKAYNINVDTNRFFKREFEYNNKIFRIIGEHGNEVEPASAFPDFNLPTDSSLSYHIAKVFVYKIMRIGNQKKKQHWVRHIDNVDIDLLLYWSLSKYFYYEIGPILRTIMVPMFILLSLAIPYLIFDVVTDFYHPRFLESLLLFLDTNIFMKIIVFILYFDLAVVVLLFIISLLRKDFSKRLHQYGIQSLHEIIISKTRSFAEHAEAVVKGENPYHQKANLYVTGHTHSAELKEFKDNNFIFADTGSWKQLMKRMPAYLNFPSVFFPYYSLTYLTCTNTKDGIDIQLRAWPKDFMPSLSLLERFAIKRKKHVPKPYLVDTLIKGIHID